MRMEQIQGHPSALNAVVCKVGPRAPSKDEMDGVQRNRRRQVDGEVEAVHAIDQFNLRVAQIPGRDGTCGADLAVNALYERMAAEAGLGKLGSLVGLAEA